MNEEIKVKAATTIMALAHRTESAGKKDGKDAKASKAPWQPMPHSRNQLMHELKQKMGSE